MGIKLIGSLLREFIAFAANAHEQKSAVARKKSVIGLTFRMLDNNTYAVVLQGKIRILWRSRQTFSLQKFSSYILFFQKISRMG